MIITGKIVDENGRGLPGAAVYISDSQGRVIGNGVSTRNDGSYTLDVEPISRVGIRFIGYQPIVTLATTLSNNPILSMVPSSQMLDEVVVTPQKNKSNAFLWTLGIVTLIALIKIRMRS